MTSPILKVKIPEDRLKEQREKLAAEHANDAYVFRGDNWERQDAIIQDDLRTRRKGIRNRILAAVAVIAAVTGVAKYKHDVHAVYEASQGEEDPQSGKVSGVAGSTATSHASIHQPKPQKIEVQQDIAPEFFALAEAMMDRGVLSTQYLEKAEKVAWSREVVKQMSRANIPLTRQNLMIVLATVDHESRFHETGIVHNPEGILDREITEFRTKHSEAYAIMKGEIPELRAAALKFINGRRAYNLAHSGKLGQKAGYFTEKDVNLAIDFAMEQYDAKAPDALKGLIPKESLHAYRPKTSGCMQMNVKKAIALAKSVDGEEYGARRMRETLYTRSGGLYYGMLYLNSIIRAHTSPNGGGMSANEVKNVFADYNMGLYTTRNAAIQANINEVLPKSEKRIAADGDLVQYESNGEASGKRSDTELAIRVVLGDAGSDLSDLEIRVDLLLEKSENFEDTRTYRKLMAIFKSHGLTKTDVIPSGKTSGSFVKFGTNKLNGAGYAAGSYAKYDALKAAMKGYVPPKPAVASKGKSTKLKGAKK